MLFHAGFFCNINQKIFVVGIRIKIKYWNGKFEKMPIKILIKSWSKNLNKKWHKKQISSRFFTKSRFILTQSQKVSGKNS